MTLRETKNLSANRFELTIAISAEELSEGVKKAYNQRKDSISIPGFRKGKAPFAMVIKMYGEEAFYEDALNILYPDAVDSAIKESGLKVINDKMDTEIESISKEDGVVLKVAVTTYPEIEIGKYKGLKAEKLIAKVEESEVEAQIKAMADRNARMVAVEDRAAANGDTVVIDFEGFVDGVAFDGGKGENYELTLGSGQFIPGFEEQVVGHNIGEEFDVNVKFPTEYTPELADKDAVFKIKLHEIKVKELPEVDDEFAQDAADCDTVAALKKSIETEIKEHKEHENEKEIENQILEKLSENVKGEIPEVMFDNELNNQIRDIDYRLSMQGMNFETYLQYMGMTVEMYKENAKESALKNVKIRLALEKIAALEELDVTEEELEGEYDKFDAQYGMEKDKIKEVVSAEGLKKDMLVEKAIKFVRDNAKVTTARKPRAKKEEAKDAE